MRLLVTGGAGFIGSAFVRQRLLGSNDSVTVLDKLTYAGGRDNLADLEADQAVGARLLFEEGDICDPALVGRLVAEADAVVNFAAESHVDRSILDADAFLRTGVLGVRVLLDAVREHAQGRTVRFLQVSTDEVYGSVETGTSSEDDPLAPRSPYAAAKAAGELLVGAYRATYGLDTLVTRGANTYGPRQHPEKLLPLFITNAIDGQPLPLYGDGLQRRDWLHVEDHASAIGWVLDRGAAGASYNVPGGQERTNREITEALLSLLARPWSLVRQVADRPGHDRRYAMSGDLLAARGWRPTMALDAGLAQTVEWYSENEPWWRARKDGAWADYYARQYERRLADSVPA